MSRFLLLDTTMFLLAIGVTACAAEQAKTDRQAGPAPFQRIRQAGNGPIETQSAVTHVVFEQRVEQATAPDGTTREEVRKIERPVTETRTYATRLNSAEAFMADGAIVEGKQLSERLAQADAVAIYWLSQEPDADYLKLLKSGTLVVCIPDSPAMGRRPLLAAGPRPDGGPQPESPRPAGSPPPAQEKPPPAPAHPPRADAAYAKIDAQGQLAIRRPPSKTVANKNAAVDVFIALIPLESVRAYDLQNKRLDQAKLQAALKNETLVLVAKGNDPVDAYYAQIMKPDTLILVIDAKP